METCRQGPLPLKGRKDNEKGDQPIKENKEERKEEEEMRGEFWKLSFQRMVADIDDNAEVSE